MFKRPLPLVVGIVVVVIAGLLLAKYRGAPTQEFQTVSLPAVRLRRR